MVSDEEQRLVDVRLAVREAKRAIKKKIKKDDEYAENSNDDEENDHNKRKIVATSSITFISASNEPILLINSGYDQTIRFWQAKTATIYRTIMHKESPTDCFAIHPQKTLLPASSYQHIKMYDLMSNNSNPVMKLD
ncbi:unnamed protein product [Rotaria sp. Silwood2]|nr:unnamed protein product [Rotaria sp. Silwood2]